MPTTKPEFTGEGFEMLESTATEMHGVTVYRVQATRDRLGGRIRAGSIGGFIMTRSNLSGDAWVADDSVVASPTARLKESALLCQNSVMTGKASAGGSARILGSTLTDNAFAVQSCTVRKSTISGRSWVLGNSVVDQSKLGVGCYIKGNTNVYNCEFEAKVQMSEDAVAEDSTQKEELSLIGRNKLIGNQLFL